MRETGIKRLRRILPLARIAAPIALLLLTFSAIDGRAALSALRYAELEPILGGLLVMQVQIVLSALRWRFTARRLGQSLPWLHAIREYYLTTFVNQVVPGGMAGDAVRAARNRVRDASGRARWGVAVRAIVLERMAGQIAFVAVTGAGLLAWPFLVGRQAPDESTNVLAGLLVGFGVLVLLAGILALVGPRRWRPFMKSFGPDMKRAYLDRWAWVTQGVLSLALVATYVGVFVAAAFAVGAPVPPVGWVTVMPLAILTMLVPVSIGGWGLREAAAAALWPLVGVASSHGVASAVLYGLITLVGSLPGLFVFRGKRRAGDPHPSSRA